MTIKSCKNCVDGEKSAYDYPCSVCTLGFLKRFDKTVHFRPKQKTIKRGTKK